MSVHQVQAVVRDIEAVFNNWGPDTPIEQIRRDFARLFSSVKPAVGALAEPINAGGVKAEWISAPDARKTRAVIYLHGGGFVLGSVHSHRDVSERLSRATRAKVLALDYRLAPENPFPAAVEDTLAAYRWLLKNGFAPDQIALAGDSAGASLCLSAMISLRDAGEALPACAILMSPWVDLECTGESMTSRDALDPMVHKSFVTVMSAAYLSSGDASTPLASPLHADLKGLPPMMIHVGERETLHDDATRLAARAKKAGVKVQLKVWPGQIHVFQAFASRIEEGEASLRELGQFVRRHID